MNEDILLVIGASSEVGCQYLEKYGERYGLIYAHYNHYNPVFDRLAFEMGEKLVLIQDDLNTSVGGAKIVERICSLGLWPNCILHCAAPSVENIRFQKTEWKTFATNLNVMVGSLVRVLPDVFKHLVKGKIAGRCAVVLSSCSEGIPPKFMAPYVTAKYALLGMMKALSSEYSDKGIMVNGVSPGMMETKFLNNIFDHAIEDNANNSPFGRNLEVNEIIPTIDFLLSDKADRITGQNIVISGGM